MIRDHKPIVIEEFNGLWKRGDADSTPPDHFSDCNNLAYIQSGFRWRDGVDVYLGVPNIIRMYTFTQETGQSLLILDADGFIWDSNYYPGSAILSVSGITDFGYFGYAGRAYITPCDGNTGLENESVYVYLGDGNPARVAAGDKPTDSDGALAAANSGTAGNIEAGIHVFAVVYETNTGFLTAIGPDTLPTVTAPGSEQVNLTNIPVSPNSYVTDVHVVATRAINPLVWTGDTRGYQFFFVPGAVVTNGTTTLSVSFFDSELLEDATYLLDMYEAIPACAGLTSYHNRMVGWATFDNPSDILVSVPGEPEAFSQVDGLITFPLDGKPVTNVQEFRDTLYAFKRTKTNAWADNNDVPSSWALTILDQGIGAGLHSVTRVLDSEGVNTDYLLVGSYSGLIAFNGAYQYPELTWKIRDLWLEIDRNDFNDVQIVNDSIAQKIYIALPNRTLLVGDYSNGLDAKNIRWAPWSFGFAVTTLALINGNELLFGSNGAL